MNEEEIKQIECTRKKKFHSHKKVSQALAKMKKALKLPPPGLNYYRCRFCRCYHLGNNRK